MVGKLSRIRVSSVTRILPPRVSVGTLKSTRTNTRFPRTSRSRSESFGIYFLLNIDMSNVRQAMTDHIHGRLRLFERDIADQRLVLAVYRFHLEEEHFTDNAMESWNLNVNGAAHFAFNHFLGR